jgi:hypothetical protein
VDAPEPWVLAAVRLYRPRPRFREWVILWALGTWPRSLLPDRQPQWVLRLP